MYNKVFVGLLLLLFPIWIVGDAIGSSRRAMQLGRFEGFSAEKMSALIDAYSKTDERKLQDKTFCELFDEDAFGDDIFQTVGCTCDESDKSFTLTCVTDDLCVFHSEGDLTYYRGDFSYVAQGDYSNRSNLVFDEFLCFDYNHQEKACLNNLFDVGGCTITVGDSSCQSCSVCDEDQGLLTFQCNGNVTDECAGDSLEGTPLQFYSRDSKVCGANSFCREIEKLIHFDDPVYEEMFCECKDDEETFEVSCNKDDVCVEYTNGRRSFFNGNLSYQYEGDFFSESVGLELKDALCFAYTDGDAACISGLESRAKCSMTFGNTTCESCVICDKVDGLISFECNGVKKNQCAGDSLEGTPFQFYSRDIKVCEGNADPLSGQDAGFTGSESNNSGSTGHVGVIFAIIVSGLFALV